VTRDSVPLQYLIKYYALSSFGIELFPTQKHQMDEKTRILAHSINSLFQTVRGNERGKERPGSIVSETKKWNFATNSYIKRIAF